MKNPFVPTFGRDPYILVGRDDAITDFEEAFEPGSNSPVLTTLITGQRGIGKTVMLNAYEEAARNQQWMVISETGRPGLLQRLAEEHLPSLLREVSVSNVSSGRALKGIGVSVAGLGANASWEVTDRRAPSLRHQIEVVCDHLGAHGTGLAITVDEVHSGKPEELGLLGDIVQFVNRNEQPLAFAAAGLRVYMDDFLNEKGTTFLRRAERLDLGNITDLRLVADAMYRTVRDAGKEISTEALEAAAGHTYGYPYLIQLVGYEAWKRSADRPEITLADVSESYPQVRRNMGNRIHVPSLHGLSDIDKSYLLAMSLDPGPSSTATLAERLAVSPNYASAYRSRLLRAGLIEEAGRGQVRFAIPYLRDYLQEEDAGHAMNALHRASPPPEPGSKSSGTTERPSQSSSTSSSRAGSGSPKP